MKSLAPLGVLAIAFVLVLTIQAFAATTISTNISTGGTLSVTGTSTLTGPAVIGAGSLSASDLAQSGWNYGLTMFGSTSGNAILEIHNSYAEGIDMYTHADAAFRAPYVNFYKSRGTEGAPTAITYTGYENDSMGGINFGGYDGSAYGVGAAIYTNNDENWTSTAHGGHVNIYDTFRGRTLQNQVVQFGGVDPSGVGPATYGNVIFYRALTFGGNLSGDPGIFYTINPAVFSIRTADNAADAKLTVGQFTASGNAGVGTSTPVANFQVANGSNATTTAEFGSSGQNKGSCLKLYRSDGSAIYAYVAAGATSFTLTTTACANVTNF